MEKGQWFRTPCLGCCEFPVKKLELVEDFDYSQISPEIIGMGDVDFGFMSYRVEFKDKGIPLNNDWENPKFSDSATTKYYRPHMVKGIIDVAAYKDVMKC
jgi:CRISPR-associated protein Cas5d